MSVGNISIFNFPGVREGKKGTTQPRRSLASNSHFHSWHRRNDIRSTLIFLLSLFRYHLNRKCLARLERGCFCNLMKGRSSYFKLRKSFPICNFTILNREKLFPLVERGEDWKVFLFFLFRHRKKTVFKVFRWDRETAREEVERCLELKDHFEIFTRRIANCFPHH